MFSFLAHSRSSRISKRNTDVLFAHKIQKLQGRLGRYKSKPVPYLYQEQPKEPRKVYFSLNIVEHVIKLEDLIGYQHIWLNSYSSVHEKPTADSIAQTKLESWGEINNLYPFKRPSLTLLSYGLYLTIQLQFLSCLQVCWKSPALPNAK